MISKFKHATSTACLSLSTPKMQFCRTSNCLARSKIDPRPASPKSALDFCPSFVSPADLGEVPRRGGGGNWGRGDFNLDKNYRFHKHSIFSFPYSCSPNGGALRACYAKDGPRAEPCRSEGGQSLDRVPVFRIVEGDSLRAKRNRRGYPFIKHAKHGTA